MAGRGARRSRAGGGGGGPPRRLEIAGIAAGGEGVGRLADGRVAFVHRTAPGENVEIAILDERPRWVRGRLLRVLEPSPDRRPAPCPHYAECGGCTIEHLEYPAQLRAKSGIVAEALARIGGISLPPPEVVASPLQHRYRNRVSFTLLRSGGGRVVAGFHALHAPRRVVDVDGACLLPEEAISTVWDGLRAGWGPDARRLPAGEKLRLTLRGTQAGRVSLLVEGGYSPGRPAELLEEVAGLESVWHRPEGGAPQWLAGAASLPETWGEETFELSGTAFLQVNRRAAALLEEHVVTAAGVVAGRHVVDAYCGIGLHARRLARGGARVTGIELDPVAVGIAAQEAPRGTRFLEGRVEALLESALPADLLILNPPRGGVEPGAIAAILACPPERVIYVSCDPATLARDLKRLAEACRVREVLCFDLFPQTAHVETVVQLERVAGGEGAGV